MTIFSSAAPADTATPLKPMKPDQVQSIVSRVLDDAVSFCSGDLSNRRQAADKYYQGETSLKNVPGQSRVTVTKVRDAVRSIVPSLARIFTQSDKIAEFYSDDEEDEKICEDATNFCNAVFAKNNGYRALISACTDALKARVGVVKATLEVVKVPIHRRQRTLMPMATAELTDELSGRITELDAEADPNNPDVFQAGAVAVATTYRERKKWSILCVPPEEFIIDENATCLDDARVIAHRRNERIGTLMEMGFSYEQLSKLDAAEDSLNDEAGERSDIEAYEDSDESTSSDDPLSKEVLFTEAYIKLDEDGDGVLEFRRIACGGTNYKILSDEPVNHHPFAVFTSEIQPHVFHPISVAEDTMQDQDAQTALLRSIINNTALVNSPRTEVNENVVNMDDIKSGAIGAIIRVAQVGQINELTTPFVAGQTLPVLQYLNDVFEARTGITALSQGTSSDALQSTSSVAANAAVTAAEARIEMMARNLAETGLTDLFLCILRTSMHSLQGAQSIRVENGFQSVRPDLWHDMLSVKVNVGMGSGRLNEKRQALMALVPIQQQIVQTLGLSNPLCSWNNMRETIADLLRLNGVVTTTKYFPMVDEAMLAELDKKQAEAAQRKEGIALQAAKQQMDAMQAMVRVEQQKAQLKFQTDMASMQQKFTTEINTLKAQLVEAKAKQDLEMTKVYLEDDRVRDKNDQDFSVNVQKTMMDQARVAATMERVDEPRVDGVPEDVMREETAEPMQEDANESAAEYQLQPESEPPGR
jgi:hypothetical protein